MASYPKTAWGEHCTYQHVNAHNDPAGVTPCPVTCGHSAHADVNMSTPTVTQLESLHALWPLGTCRCQWHNDPPRSSCSHWVLCMRQLGTCTCKSSSSCSRQVTTTWVACDHIHAHVHVHVASCTCTCPAAATWAGHDRGRP